MKRCLFLATTVVAIASAFFLARPWNAAQAQAPCPTPAPVIMSATPPADVDIPACAQGQFPIAYFDDYSWRTFLAMVWPASPSRGAPNLTKSLDDGTIAGVTHIPRVFETFKQDWEIFNGAPLPASTMMPSFATTGTPNPCGLASATWADVILGSFTFSKLGNLGEADNSAAHLSGPLVAQNHTYVRYQTAFNQISYDAINAGRHDLPANQAGFSLPNGAIDIKAAWMDMTGVPNPHRFYTTLAWVFDPATRGCAQKTIGLVALHIVQKTPSRPQWIWTTFEHVDNVPPTTAGNSAGFNDGSGTPMPGSNPIGFPPPVNAPAPFNVTRILPLEDSTTSTNVAYHQALLTSDPNSVWANYRLVMTQWPVPIPVNNATVDPNQSGAVSTFPDPNNADSADANPAMETFEQQAPQSGGIGCMSCHSTMQKRTDFVWALRVNALHNLTAASSQPAVNGFTAQSASLPTKVQRQLTDDLNALRQRVQSAIEHAPTPSPKP